MPLKIALKTGEKIIINGAVIENVGSGVMKALVLNNAAILRDKDIITDSEATTPASRVYFTVQNLYLFPQREEVYRPLAIQFLNEYAEAAPSAKNLVQDILNHMEDGTLYQALHLARKLVEHEGSVIGHAKDKLAATIRRRAERGESPADGSVGTDGNGPSDEGSPTGTD